MIMDPRLENVALENEIKKVFDDVWRQQMQTPPPKLERETLLATVGFDSLGFAIIVTRLDEILGFDPFSIAEDAYYPQTFGEFVSFYQKHNS